MLNIIKPNFKTFFLIAVAIKVALLLFVHYGLVDSGNYPLSGWFAIGKDTSSYFDPLENWWLNGSYNSAFRMPGMAFPYLMFRLFFDAYWSSQLLIGFHVLFEAGVIAYVTVKLFKGFKWNGGLLVVFALLPFTSFYSNFGVSESLAGSALLLIFTLFIQYRKTAIESIVLGILVTWLIFLKPVMGVLLIPMVGYIFIKSTRWGKVKNVLLFVLPFLIVESTWILNNYRQTKRIIPLTTAYDKGEVKHYMLFFVKSFGGDFQSWKPDMLATWFEMKTSSKYNEKLAQSNPFPDYVFSAELTLDSLKAYRGLMESYYSEKDTSIKNILREEIYERFQFAEETIRKHSPFHYQVTARISAGYYLLCPTTVYAFPFTKTGLIFKLLKAAILAAYYLIFIGYLISIVYALIRRVKWLDLILLTMPLVPIWAMVFLKLQEHRYVTPFVGVMFILSIYFVLSIRKKNEDTITD